MKVHFIAIGGSAMHNLALALHYKGYQVTGSDDEVFEPSKSRLKAEGLLPEKEGWFVENIHADLDAVILGMHAREDNPELIKAKEMGLPVYSYPEFLYQQTKDKKRLVIGGSHGKTTITSMVLHVLNKLNIHTDFMVGALLEGIPRSVVLENDTEIAVFEGDEYLSSPIDRRPKFHLYHPHVALISGIAWDHMNVFPTWENYLDQFAIFVDRIEPNGVLVYSQDDEHVVQIAKSARADIRTLPYTTPNHKIVAGKTILMTQNGDVELAIFGRHNLQNMEGARLVCAEIGVSETDFYKAIASFKGASRRLECVREEGSYVVYRDFAHAPSKLQATTAAVKEQFPDRKLLACMELHTFSSLNKAFLDHYAGTMNKADVAVVYFSPEVIAHKRLPAITVDEVKVAFGRTDLMVFTDVEALQNFIDQQEKEYLVQLMMSSGNFGGIRF
ncbi:MAG: Mur ligase family protein [Flavobacteriales bacterium]|nr:Mur ligase family protein [Flavobacteriales bacterium]